MRSMSRAATNLREPVRSSNQVVTRPSISNSLAECSCLQDGGFFALDEILILDRHQRVGVLGELDFQLVHASRRGVGPFRKFLALAVQQKSTAMAGTEKEILFRLKVDRAAKVRANRCKGIDLIPVTAHQPDAADDVVGVQGPGILSKVA